MITTIFKHLIIGVKVDYTKELNEVLAKLNIPVEKIDFYETEFHGRNLSRCYIRVLVSKFDEIKLLNYLDKDFNHNVSIIMD